MKPTFRIIKHESDEWKLAVKLREEILRKPQGENFSTKELEEEKDHIQIVGLIDKKIIATAVLINEGQVLKMQRVVVSESIRNLEIGSRMMSFCEIFAQENDIKTIYCHARDSAVNFYSKNGYAREGDYFVEDDIPHLKMTKNL